MPKRPSGSAKRQHGHAFDSMPACSLAAVRGIFGRELSAASINESPVSR